MSSLTPPHPSNHPCRSLNFPEYRSLFLEPAVCLALSVAGIYSLRIMATKPSLVTSQWMATEEFVAEIHSGSSCIPCPEQAVNFFTLSHSTAFCISGTDRWSYSVHLQFKRLQKPTSLAPSIVFLPHSRVDELTPNRLVIHNVSITDMSFLSFILPTVCGRDGRPLPQTSQLHIRSWVLVLNASAAADHDFALLRKVCKEVGALNKMSFVTRSEPVSKIVRLCKDDIRADIAAAEYQRSLDP